MRQHTFFLFCFDRLLRIFLDCDRRKQGMGASQSNSYLKYTNDFELVVRATKDLEHLLETEFGAPSGREKGLNDKVLFTSCGCICLVPVLLVVLLCLVLFCLTVSSFCSDVEIVFVLTCGVVC